MLKKLSKVSNRGFFIYRRYLEIMPSKAQLKARAAFVKNYAKKKKGSKKKGSKPYSYIKNKGSMREEMIRVPKKNVNQPYLAAHGISPKVDALASRIARSIVDNTGVDRREESNIYDIIVDVLHEKRVGGMKAGYWIDLGV